MNHLENATTYVAVFEMTYKKRSMRTKNILMALCLLFSIWWTTNGSAQCVLQNHALSGGETILYDLYFNFGIIQKRAGKGTFSTVEANYKGTPALKSVMMMQTSGMVNSFYTVRDTLTSYIDRNLRPLSFTKEALEGDDYSIDNQIYKYNGDQIKIKVSRIRNGEKKFKEHVTTEKCTYDYLSVLSYVRNLDFSGMKPGDRQYIQFLSGRTPVEMYVNYLGTSTIKANDGKKYEVVDISMTIYDEAFSDQKEALRASLTNDANHIPVILDTSLKIGTIRAVLRSFSSASQK